MADPTSLLVISGNGVMPYSARGLHQSLEPIDLIKGLVGRGVMRRTVNGTLIDLTPPQMRKYKSEITCSDQQAPALDGIWPGMTVTVDCVAELSYTTATGTPARTVVSSYTDGLFTIYRPRIVFLVTDYSVDKDEWGAMTSWKLDLEEV